MERRNSPRSKCQFRCELSHLHQRASGAVLDISENGLSVHTQLEVEQGESLLVRIEVPSQGSLDLEAIVWHIRRGRRRDSGEPCNLLGLMVCKAPAAYFRLLPHMAPDEPQQLE
ncbi:MAG: PilZ domain-containing protein [bacterium]|nr:PilZ domain-containing protein [bacterium]